MHLRYGICHGLWYAKTDDWGHTGCHTQVLPSKSHVKLHHVLNDARAFSDVRKAIHYLQTQPILAQIGIFKPEFGRIGNVSDLFKEIFWML
ncbi:hypothetical protein Bca52824_096157 [Brassica carinata]|uniref:Uncharacterized protein n=1 Tax=Brassica carinata TaxID=52824 RepID=A0A8X7P053_BRACI|nr:hypothetical protein Bca52824_096157 [Brassica carinata]